MNGRNTALRTVIAALMLVAAWSLFSPMGSGPRALAAQKKEREKDAAEGKKGKTIGTVTAKGKEYIEVKAAGEEKARKYFPRWVGGLPAQGGGFDKNIVKTFRELKVGSRVEVDWVFEERLRAVTVRVLKGAEKQDD